MISPQTRVPSLDVSPITDELYIAARPQPGHASDWARLDIDLVIVMSLRRLVAPSQGRPRLLRLPTLDSPLWPIPLELIWRGVGAALPVLDAGGRVLVYCRAGRHRSVCMVSCILIACGMTADDAMDLVLARRPKADPHIFYIERRIRAFESDWLSHQKSAETSPVARGQA